MPRKRTKQSGVDAPVVFGATHVGKVRPGNEDRCRVLEGKDLPDGIDAIMVVADGMGGHAAGEVASEMTVDGVTRLLISQLPDATIRGKGYPELLGRIIDEVNLEVLHRAEKEPKYKGMGTTCTVGVLKGSELYVGHVGDSRGYILEHRGLVQITKDHSWVAEQVEAGNLTRTEAENHPYRNVVTRAIGIGREVLSDTFVKSVAPGDKVLLCSDGLHSVVGDSEIGEELKSRDAEAACHKLISLANDKGGPDNITVVVAEVGQQDSASTTQRMDRKGKGGKHERRSPGVLGRIINWLFKPNR